MTSQEQQESRVDYPQIAQDGAPRIGAHHLTPENIAATIADLRAIQAGTESIPVLDRDHRTEAGVLALIMEHLVAATQGAASAEPAEREAFEAAMGEELKVSQGQYALSRAHMTGRPYTFLATIWAWEGWQRARATATQGAPTPVQVGWICRDDLEHLLQSGSATVYEEQQEFRLLAPQPQYAVYVHDAGVKESASTDQPKTIEAAQQEAYAEGRKDEQEHLEKLDILTDCPACNGIGERPVFDTNMGPYEGDGGIQSCPNCSGTGYATPDPRDAFVAELVAGLRRAEEKRQLDLSALPPGTCSTCMGEGYLGSIESQRVTDCPDCVGGVRKDKQ